MARYRMIYLVALATMAAMVQSAQAPSPSALMSAAIEANHKFVEDHNKWSAQFNPAMTSRTDRALWRQVEHDWDDYRYAMRALGY